MRRSVTETLAADEILQCRCRAGESWLADCSRAVVQRLRNSGRRTACWSMVLGWFTCLQTVTHPGTNHLIVTQPGVEPTISRSQVQCSNRYTTKPPWYHISHVC